MPVLYGQGVAVESPDVLSKFSASGRPMMVPVTPGAQAGGDASSANDTSHDFSPMPATPSTPAEVLPYKASPAKAAGAMPVLYGQGVAIESPDAMSRFHSKPREMVFLSPVIEGEGSQHGFSPMPATTSDALPAHASNSGNSPAPIIYGQGVTVDSPDVLSRYNHTAPAPASSETDIMHAGMLNDGITTVPGVHRRRYLRNQSYVSTSVDSALSPSAPTSPKPRRAGKDRDQDLFCETLSPLKESYGSLVKKIRGQHVPPLKGHKHRDREDGFSAQATPVTESHLRRVSSVSTFKATVLTPHKRTPVRANKDSSSNDRSGGGSSPSHAVRQDADLSSTVSPYKENYDDIRAKLNAELAEAETMESVQVDRAVVYRPTPPPPRRGAINKHAFAFNTAGASGHDVTGSRNAPSGFNRSGRKLSPTNIGADLEKENTHSNVQIVSFEQPQGMMGAVEGEHADSPAPKSGRPAQGSFRRSGRILRESRSEPILSVTCPNLEEDVVGQPLFQAMASEERYEEETGRKTKTDSGEDQEGNSSLRSFNPADDPADDSDGILAAIDRFELASAAAPDDELVTLAPLENSGEDEHSADPLPPRTLVTFVGSNLAPGTSLKKEKKRRRANLFFRPSLECLLESEEVVLNFPLWIAPAPKFTKRAFPTDSIVVKASADPLEQMHDDKEVDSILAQQEERVVGRLRRRSLRAPDEEREREEQDAETPLIRQDTYGKWLQAQCSSVCREENSQACTTGDHDAIFRAIETFNNEHLKTLTKQGVSLLSPECLDKFKNTPLMAAVMVNNKKIVKLLLKHQVDYDAVNSFGNTALHFAVEFQLPSTTKYLLRKGASRDIKNSLGMVAGERVITEEQ